jgi:hypothetical protein
LNSDQDIRPKNFSISQTNFKLLEFKLNVTIKLINNRDTFINKDYEKKKITTLSFSLIEGSFFFTYINYKGPMQLKMVKKK